MLTRQIAQYLAANGIGTLDTNIFYESLPSAPNAAVAVFSTGGFESSVVHGYDDPTIQIRVRDTSPTGAYNRIGAIYSLLQGLNHTNLITGGIRVIQAQAIQSHPENIGKDEQGRIEYTMNYRLEIRNITANRE